MKSLALILVAVFSVIVLSSGSFAGPIGWGPGTKMDLPYPVSALLSSDEVLRAMNKLVGRGGMVFDGIVATRVNSETWNYTFVFSHKNPNGVPESGQFTVTAGGLAWGIRSVSEPQTIAPAILPMSSNH